MKLFFNTYIHLFERQTQKETDDGYQGNQSRAEFASNQTGTDSRILAGPSGCETTFPTMRGTNPYSVSRELILYQGRCTSLPRASFSAAHSFTYVILLHGKGKPVAVVP